MKNRQPVLGGLFDPKPPRYPDGAGWKAPGPSQEAAETTDADRIRERVYRWLRANGPHTADETATGLGLSVLTARPRLSELLAHGRLVDTGDRRLNVSGKRATVWKAI